MYLSRGLYLSALTFQTGTVLKYNTLTQGYILKNLTIALCFFLIEVFPIINYPNGDVTSSSPGNLYLD